MPTDQATRLRLLVSDEASDEVVAKPRAWRTLSVVGAKGGVGTSTVALNVAVTLSVVGCRVELASTNDREARERDLHPGPAGVALRNAAAWRSFCSASRHRALMSQPAETPDWLVVDAGRCDADSFPADPLEQSLIVTTAEPLAMLAAFAAFRLARENGLAAELVINRTGEVSDAANFNARFKETSRRMLGCCPVIHELPEDAAVLDAARLGRPVVLARPACPFSRGVQRLADHGTSAYCDRAA